MSGSLQVRARFRPLNPATTPAVLDAPFAIPTTLGRRGLSEVVNHLLQESEHRDELNSNTSFDFLVHGVFLTQTLQQFLETRKLSSEDVLPIEYFLSVKMEKPHASVSTNSWISCIDVLDKDQPYLATGSFDGKIQFFEKKKLLLAGRNDYNVAFSFSCHEDPVRDLQCFSFANQSRLASASKDHSIHIYDLHFGSSIEKMHQSAELLGHLSSVESLCFWESKSLLLSGDWQGNLLGWNISQLQDKRATRDGNVKKRQKVDSNQENQKIEMKPVFSIKANSQCISHMTHVGNHCFTSSYDHSIKKWDMETQDCIVTINTSKVTTSIDIHSQSSESEVLTSQVDGKIRLWDMRVQGSSHGSISSFGLKNDHIWTSQVKWSPTRENLFASGNYNGVVHLFDKRSSLALMSQSCHQGKVFCVDWLDDCIVSGGDDSSLKITAIQ